MILILRGHIHESCNSCNLYNFVKDSYTSNSILVRAIENELVYTVSGVGSKIT